MEKAAAKVLVAGLLHDGLDVERMSPTARAEVRAALDKVLDMTAEPKDLMQALIDCQTLTPSLMTGDAAIERLKEINVLVYRARGM